MSAALAILGFLFLFIVLFGISTDISRAWKRWRQRRQLEALWRQPCAKDRGLV